jgi:hypothetical protein
MFFNQTKQVLVLSSEPIDLATLLFSKATTMESIA